MLNFFLDAAAGATDAVAQEGGLMAQLSFPLMLVAMIAVFYFLMIRPQKKQEKEAQAMRNSISVGDTITTIGGITGTVVDVKETRIVLETGADQVRIELEKWAISTNETAAENAKAEAKKAQEAKAKAKAAKKAEKNQ